MKHFIISYLFLLVSMQSPLMAVASRAPSYSLPTKQSQEPIDYQGLVKNHTLQATYALINLIFPAAHAGCLVVSPATTCPDGSSPSGVAAGPPAPPSGGSSVTLIDENCDPATDPRCVCGTFSTASGPQEVCMKNGRSTSDSATLNDLTDEELIILVNELESARQELIKAMGAMYNQELSEAQVGAAYVEYYTKLNRAAQLQNINKLKNEREILRNQLQPYLNCRSTSRSCETNFYTISLALENKDTEYKNAVDAYLSGLATIGEQIEQQVQDTKDALAADGFNDDWQLFKIAQEDFFERWQKIKSDTNMTAYEKQTAYESLEASLNDLQNMAISVAGIKHLKCDPIDHGSNTQPESYFLFRSGCAMFIAAQINQTTRQKKSIQSIRDGLDQIDPSVAMDEQLKNLKLVAMLQEQQISSVELRSVSKDSALEMFKSALDMAQKEFDEKMDKIMEINQKIAGAAAIAGYNKSKKKTNWLKLIACLALVGAVCYFWRWWKDEHKDRQEAAEAKLAEYRNLKKEYSKHAHLTCQAVNAASLGISDDVIGTLTSTYDGARRLMVEKLYPEKTKGRVLFSWLKYRGIIDYKTKFTAEELNKSIVKFNNLLKKHSIATSTKVINFLFATAKAENSTGSTDLINRVNEIDSSGSTTNDSDNIQNNVISNQQQGQRAERLNNSNVTDALINSQTSNNASLTKGEEEGLAMQAQSGNFEIFMEMKKLEIFNPSAASNPNNAAGGDPLPGGAANCPGIEQEPRGQVQAFPYPCHRVEYLRRIVSITAANVQQMSGSELDTAIDRRNTFANFIQTSRDRMMIGGGSQQQGAAATTSVRGNTRPQEAVVFAIKDSGSLINIESGLNKFNEAKKKQSDSISAGEDSINSTLKNNGQKEVNFVARDKQLRINSRRRILSNLLDKSKNVKDSKSRFLKDLLDRGGSYDKDLVAAANAANAGKSGPGGSGGATGNNFDPSLASGVKGAGGSKGTSDSEDAAKNALLEDMLSKSKYQKSKNRGSYNSASYSGRSGDSAHGKSSSGSRGGSDYGAFAEDDFNALDSKTGLTRFEKKAIFNDIKSGKTPKSLDDDTLFNRVTKQYFRRLPTLLYFDD